MDWDKVLRGSEYPAYARAAQLTFPSNAPNIIAGEASSIASMPDFPGFRIPILSVAVTDVGGEYQKMRSNQKKTRAPKREIEKP